LLHQTCPEATVTVLRIMGADGIVPEGDLDKCLVELGLYLDENPGTVDALVLSLGYYVETADDAAYTPGLKELLENLASKNVTIFASAGNDATDRKSYPAAFAPEPLFGDPGHCLLVSVAALNPDERTVALFSNDGPWVTAQAVGANVISTAPTTAQGSWLPGARTVDQRKHVRSTIDPDDFSGGFATWSGTSFAAPVLAGHFLTSVLKVGLAIASVVAAERPVCAPQYRRGATNDGRDDQRRRNGDRPVGAGTGLR
jgi:subtilisin family serine protease